MGWTSTSLTMQHHGRTEAWLHHDARKKSMNKLKDRIRDVTRRTRDKGLAFVIAK